MIRSDQYLRFGTHVIRGLIYEKKKVVRMFSPHTVMASGGTEELERPASFKSPVWEHFGFPVKYNDERKRLVDKTVTVCRHCGTRKPYDNGNTSSMATHLKRHHTGVSLMALFHCMVRHGTVRYGSLLGGFPLGTVPGTWYFFSTTSVEVPCKPYRYQNVTCKLCWSLIGLRKSSLLRHWTCDTRPSSTVLPARFKSAQPAKDRTQLLFKQTHIFASTTK